MAERDPERDAPDDAAEGAAARQRVTNETARITLASALVGVTVGVLAGVFREVVEGLLTAITSPAFASLAGPVLPVAAGAAMAVAAWWIVRRFAPEAAGSGVQEIEGALAGTRPVRWRRVIPTKFASAGLALGSGMALGREGPTVQMGGSVGAMWSEPLRFDASERHVLVAAGAAAGLSAAFNAPLAGAIFIVEEMRPQFRYGFVSFQSVLVASVCSDVVIRAISGQGPVLATASLAAPLLASLPAFLLYGALLGLLGFLFSSGVIAALDGVDRLPVPGRAAWAGLVGGAVGLVGWLDPSFVGGGYATIHRALTLDNAVTLLLGVFVLRFALTLASFSTGVSGGIFAPMLALGTLVGLAFGQVTGGVLGDLVPSPGVFAVAGMAAFFAATVRAPITGIVLTIEMTGSFELILVLLVTCLAANYTAELLGGRPIYETLLERTIAKEAAQAAQTVEGDEAEAAS